MNTDKMSGDNVALANDLARFFVAACFDAARTAGVQRLREGRADVEDKRVLKDRLNAYVVNGYSNARAIAKKLIERIDQL